MPCTAFSKHSSAVMGQTKLNSFLLLFFFFLFPSHTLSSLPTLQILGLQEAQYRVVTEIQRQTIGLALQGKDVLGAAKTGSGKTLAFIVPVSNLHPSISTQTKLSVKY